MQIVLRVKWFDADWSGQIVFLLLFSNKGKSCTVKMCWKHAQRRSAQRNWTWGLWHWDALRKGGRAVWAEGVKDCAGICQKPIIILVQKRSTLSERQINIALLWVWEYIQDSSNWLFLMLQWQFHLLWPQTTTTVQLPGLCVNLEKNKYNKTNGYLFG